MSLLTTAVQFGMYILLVRLIEDVVKTYMVLPDKLVGKVPVVTTFIPLVSHTSAQSAIYEELFPYNLAIIVSLFGLLSQKDLSIYHNNEVAFGSSHFSSHFSSHLSSPITSHIHNSSHFCSSSFISHNLSHLDSSANTSDFRETIANILKIHKNTKNIFINLFNLIL